MSVLDAVPAPWVRHVIGAALPHEPQHCVLCGAAVSSHMLGALPEGAVFERHGRLFLIEPDEDTISCRDRLDTERL